MTVSDTWREVGELESVPPTWDYEPNRLVTFLLRIGEDEEAFDERYDSVRTLIAEVVNAGRALDLEELSRSRLDVWIGQRSVFGHYLDEMIVTLAGVTDLPAPSFLKPLRAVAVAQMTGRHPVIDGLFPELRIADGTIEGMWGMTDERLLALSHDYQARNGLAPATRDPYRQMLCRDSEPRDFTWLPARRRHEERAIELIPTHELEARDVPGTASVDTLITFGLTFDAHLHHGSIEAATLAYERAAAALATSAKELTIDELRTWLCVRARTARADAASVDLRLVKRAFAALRRALAEPSGCILRITPKPVAGRGTAAREP